MPSLHVLDVMTLVFAAALLVAGCMGENHHYSANHCSSY